MARVYSYLRFSSKPQEAGDSLRRQRALGTAWMKDHPEHTLDTALRLNDLGVSAFTGANLDEDRGDLGRFVHLVKQRCIPKGSILMLEAIDRFSRLPPRKAYPVFCDLVEAGVTILPLDAGQMIDQSNIDNMDVVFTIIYKMQLGFEESRTRSERLKQVNEEKRRMVAEFKLTARCPFWLRLADDRRSFEVLPDQAEIVRTVFRWAKSGLSACRITKRLNRDGMPCPCRIAGLWYEVYVKSRILRNRAVIGEHQPCRRSGGRPVPLGDPIQDYYPAIIDEQEFDSIQRSLAEKPKRPAYGRGVANLFPGLLKDARDGRRIHVGQQRRLLNPAAEQGIADTVHLPFPYERFEQALLVWGCNLKLDGIFPQRPGNLEKEVREAEGKTVRLEKQIETIKATMRNSTEKFDSWLDMLRDREEELKAARATVERLRTEATVRETEAVYQMTELVNRLRNADDKEVYSLRLKLRAELGRLISDIVVLVIQVNRYRADRIALADVEWSNGKRTKVIVKSRDLVPLPDGLDELDVREWKSWPEEFRKARFTVVTQEVQRVIKLKDAGHTEAEIARKCGVSTARVHYVLKRHGRTKPQRRLDGGDRLMYPTRSGWQKKRNGHLYYVSFGTLKRLFPHLVTERSKEGTLQAANEWWRQRLVDFKRANDAIRRS